MKSNLRFYRGCLKIAKVVFFILFRYKIEGRNNIPDGAVVICSNHSSMADPIMVSIAAGKRHHIHYIAKAELFSMPVLSSIILKLGAISVDREISDMATIKATLAYLKKGEKVGIFPEGRRAMTAREVSSKTGAVKIAEHRGVPLVPVFVPRKKSIFRRLRVTVGMPYIIEKQEAKRSAEDYSRLTEDLMDKIESLDTR